LLRSGWSSGRLFASHVLGGGWGLLASRQGCAASPWLSRGGGFFYDKRSLAVYFCGVRRAGPVSAKSDNGRAAASMTTHLCGCTIESIGIEGLSENRPGRLALLSRHRFADRLREPHLHRSTTRCPTSPLQPSPIRKVAFRRHHSASRA
jgi:hypothetical protein